MIGGADAHESAGIADAGLPAYAIRRSDRARRVRLVVTPRDGLVVVLPTGAPTSLARDAVRSKAAWANRSLARVADMREQLEAGAEALLPAQVRLDPLGEIWPVEYVESLSDSVRVRESGAHLRVTGAVGDAEKCVQALRRWRDRVASRSLPLMLAVQSNRVGHEPARVSVRGQRTRWGSCSSRGTISLNRDLIFLPAHLCEYVLVHELAHLVHGDHSPAFHALVESWFQDSRNARRELKEAWRHVPPWAVQ